MYYPQSGLPDNLSAKEYYELGLQYRLAGWVGVAREALSKVVEVDGDGSIAKKASKVLKTQLPKEPVPIEAEQKNIEGYNLMFSEPDKAKQVFKDLMGQYPDFEWPFSNTARLKLGEGDVAGAKSMVKYLLQVNPDLLSAIDLMVKIALYEEDFDEALKFLDRALALYPHEDEFKQLKLAIKIQTKGEPPKTIPEDLSAKEYFDLGVELQAVGRLEDSRKAMARVIDDSEDEVLKAKAQSFSKTQLPKFPVSEDAQKRCIEAFEQLSKDKDKAKKTLLEMTMEFPQFEWPFLFLATMYIMDGVPKKAERLIKRVLSISPDLMKAKHLLISVYLASAKYSEALEFIDQSVEEADSDDDGLALDLLRAQCQLQKSIS